MCFSPHRFLGASPQHALPQQRQYKNCNANHHPDQPRAISIFHQDFSSQPANVCWMMDL